MIKNIILRKHTGFNQGIVAEIIYKDGGTCSIFNIKDNGIYIRNIIFRIIGVDEL